ncbi:uncharacterized protein [Amphiura filiformis]|uniref:uncharacterized protein n=1 Tax=Amphiura filiformis TaxID=82378 RepID=UPI003B21AD14
MEKGALVLIFIIVCITVVTSSPLQPKAREIEEERLLELLVLKELLEPLRKRTVLLCEMRATNAISRVLGTRVECTDRMFPAGILAAPQNLIANALEEEFSDEIDITFTPTMLACDMCD